MYKKKQEIKWTLSNISLCDVRKRNNMSCRDCVLVNICDRKEREKIQEKEGKRYV